MAVVPGAQIFASFVLSALGVAFGWIQVNGGRSWWAHFEFARINIEPIILKNKIEELREARASVFLNRRRGSAKGISSDP